MSFVIAGTGSALPATVLENEQMRHFFDTSDEWIRTRTGICRRHILNGESVGALAAEAANRALQQAGVRPEELDYILCPTIGGDYLTPSLACMVQQAIGAGCPALDLNAACTGFLYALDLADALFLRGAKRILIAAAEGMSRMTDWGDRATAVLFGDGAGAAVLAPGAGLLHLHLTAQGCAEPLYAPFPAGNYPGLPGEKSAAQSAEAAYLRMDGAEVYKFAVNAIADGVARALAETGLAAEDVACYVFHQANVRIIEGACRRLALPLARCATNMDEVGNLSAASIPVLLDTAGREGLFGPGDVVVLCGFGAGFTTGTAVLRWGAAGPGVQ